VETQIKEYAKKLKLSWIPANYQTIQAETHEEYLLKLFEHEVQQWEERRINLLLKQATLPKIPNKPFDWKDIQLAPGIKREYVFKAILSKTKKTLFFMVESERERRSFPLSFP